MPGVAVREKRQGLLELVATKLPTSSGALTCPTLLPANVDGGAGVPMPFWVFPAFI